MSAPAPVLRPQPLASALAASISGLLLLLCACGGTPLPKKVPPAVTVAAALRTDASRELELSGTLSAERSIALGFATLGTVEQVLVQEGQAVEPGQVLAVLTQRSYRDALGIAEAKAKQAEDAYRRLQPMHENRTLPDVKMVEVETGRAQAELAVSMARKNLGDTELRAPVRGVIAARNVEPGMSAAPGLPAFTLVQTRTMMATAPVGEMQVARVRRGAPARVTVPALGRTLEGEVREIAVAANPLTRTYDVKVALANPDGALRVGMIADVRLKVTGGIGDAVAVPPEAVRVDERGAPYVFVVLPDGKLQRRPVTLAGFAGEATALSGGLRAGERVVTSGTPMLADGMLVRVVDEARPGSIGDGVANGRAGR
jgi:RND family efflux transporter MFP subunit